MYPRKPTNFRAQPISVRGSMAARRHMLFVDRNRGLVEVETDSGEVASYIGYHHHAIRARLGGDTDALVEFEGDELEIGDEVYAPETDAEVLVGLYWSGELDYQDPYDTGFLDEGTEET